MEPANQKPAPDQPFLLPTEREKSTIPKSGTDGEVWVYPSAQVCAYFFIIPRVPPCYIFIVDQVIQRVGGCVEPRAISRKGAHK